jgi:2-polyprenyl-3-methyl-5-hydroxy-6-metoxy-1,4-benzoquinol methylase
VIKNNFFEDHRTLICPLTHNKKFKKIFTINSFPIYMGTVHKKKKIMWKNMNFYINKSSGTVQIFPRVDLSNLYFKSHGSGKVGATWQKHHKDFFNFLKLKNKSTILEIGGGHNSISLKSSKKNIKIFSFDPNGKKISNGNKFHNEFFSNQSISKYKLYKKFDVVVHSHLFEHIYEPENFLNSIHSSLKDNGLHFFAVPNMEPMIKKGIASAMNFEHPFFLNEYTIRVLLKKTGFRILEKKYYGKYHSIFFKTVKDLKIDNIKVKNLYKKNYLLFKKLRNKWKLDVLQINKKIKKYTAKKIFIFGAHIFSQNLIKTGLNIKNIIGILDNDKDKQGEYLYGTKLKVYSPEILKQLPDPVVILRAGEYNLEIKKQILNKINHKIIFV